MGLDSYWVYPGTDETIWMTAEEQHRLSETGGAIIGGVFSDHGNGSFRGKVYDRIIVGIANETLYMEHIDNDAVRRIAEALENTPYEEAVKFETHYEIDREGYEALRTMFRIYADKGAELIGGW